MGSTTIFDINPVENVDATLKWWTKYHKLVDINFLNYIKRCLAVKWSTSLKKTYTHSLEVSYFKYGEAVLKSSEMPTKY